MGRALTTESYLEKAREVHGDLYDYSRVIYAGSTSKITIGCKKHGWFEQATHSHLGGRGCRECSRGKRGKSSNTEEFVEKAKTVHGDRYDYSEVVYVSATKKVSILCREHGSFLQSPAGHLNGYGCPRCGRDAQIEKRRGSAEEFIEKAKAVHSDSYTYEGVVYENALTKVIIGCPKHGDFLQTPANHLMGHGCPKCGGKYQSNTPEFIEKAKTIHVDKYDYSSVSYVRALSKVEIVCSIHGSFSQNPADHLTGYGCPGCGRAFSKQEEDVYNCVAQFVPAERWDKHTIEPYELDIHVREKKLAIEYCGLHWHTEAKGKTQFYHHRKHQLCEKLGIRLLTIFEDEWLTRRSAIMKLIENALGMSPRGPGARKFKIKQISSETARSFCELHHVQGATQTAYAVGAYHEGALHGVMTFGKPTRQSVHPIELRRFCTDGNYPGLGSRMFQFYVREYRPTSVVSFSDNRLFSGGLYKQLGFVRDGEVPPDYAYVKRGVRHNKSNFRTGRLRKMGFPQGSEAEIMFGLEYDRIWDCGKTRWVWKMPEESSS